MLLLQEGDRQAILYGFIDSMKQSFKDGEMTEYASTYWEYVLITFFRGDHFQMDLFIEAIRCYSDKNIDESQLAIVERKVLNGELIIEEDIRYTTQQEKDTIYNTETVNELLQKIEVLDMALSEMMMMAPQFMEGGE